MHLSRHTGLLTTAVAITACGSVPLRQWPVSTPAELCGDATLRPDDFCMPSARIEAWLASGNYRITDAARSSSGSTHPYKLRLEVEGGLAISVKFKRAPDELDAFNNSPRREIAAYAIQKLFLDADDDVVPPTVLACVPTRSGLAALDDLEPHPGVDCALGVMAYWVEGLTDEHVVDPKRWAVDAAYRDALGNLNLLTALIGHQDDLGNNFYASTDPKHPRLLSVDNGLALGAMGVNPVQLFSSSWSDVRVPVLPERAVDRLRALDRRALEHLAVLTQLRQDGRAYRVVTSTDAVDPNEGVRVRGAEVQLGLTAQEITEVDVRRAQILGALDSKEVHESMEHESHGAGK